MAGLVPNGRHVRRIDHTVAIDVGKDVVGSGTGVIHQHQVGRIHHAVVVEVALQDFQGEAGVGAGKRARRCP